MALGSRRAALTGIGMALTCPNLINTVGHVADPAWHGALGVYWLWRDGGYAV